MAHKWIVTLGLLILAACNVSDPMTDDLASIRAGETSAQSDTRAIYRYWGNTQWPLTMTLSAGAKETVYGRVWVENGTEWPGQMWGLNAELGVGPAGSDPAGANWVWVPASFNVQYGNDDEFMAQLTAPTTAGLYDYAFRYRVDGAHWAGRGTYIYGDSAGIDYESSRAAKLSVRAAGAQLKTATLNLHCLSDDPASRVDAAARRFAQLGTEFVALQEVCEGQSWGPATNTADYLARRLSELTGKTWTFRFAQTHLAWNTPPEGIGLVTSLPIVAEETWDLPTREFPRKAMLVQVGTPMGLVAMVSTHLSFQSDQVEMRTEQVKYLKAMADRWQSPEQASAHVVIAGDFNADLSERSLKVLTEAGFESAWVAANGNATGNTFPSSWPSVRIDHVMFRAKTTGALRVDGARLEFNSPYRDGKYVSDHIGLSVTLTQR